MARKASQVFATGKMADTVLGSDGAIITLRDAYIDATGRVVGRGARKTNLSISACSAASSSASYCAAGTTHAVSHPKLGVLTCEAHTTHDTPIGNESWMLYPTYRYMSQHAIGLMPASSIITTAFASNSSGSWTKVSSTSSFFSSASSTGGRDVPFGRVVHSCLLDSEVVFACRDNQTYSGRKQVFKWGGSTCSITSAASASGVYWSASSRYASATGSVFTSAHVGAYLHVNDAVGSAVTTDPCIGGSGATLNGAIGNRITKLVNASCVELERVISSASVASASRVAWGITPIALVCDGKLDSAWGNESGALTHSWDGPKSFGSVCYHKGRLFLDDCSDYLTSETSNDGGLRWSVTKGANPNSAADHIDFWQRSARTLSWNGFGGVSRGMVSMGNDLIIIKERALIRMTGTVTDSGLGDANFTVISDTIGAYGDSAWCMTPMGLAVANASGVFLYDGSNLTNILKDKAMSEWPQDAFEYSLNIAGTWLYIDFFYNHGLVDYTTYSFQNNWVLNLSNGNLHTQTTMPHRSIVRAQPQDPTYYLGNEPSYWGFHEYGLAGLASASGGHGRYSCVSGDWSEPTNVGDTTDSYQGLVSGIFSGPSPAMSVGFLLGNLPFEEGRVINAYVHGKIHTDVTAASASAVGATAGCYMKVSLQYGLRNTLDRLTPTNGWRTWTSDDASGRIGANTKERTHRVPMDGASQDANSFVQVIVEGVGPHQEFNVYAVGIDYEPSNRISSDYTSSD